VSERDESHVATGDAAPASDRDRPVDGPTTGEEGEVTDLADDADVLQAVVDFIGDLVESDEPGGGGRANGGGDGEVSPKAPRT
jgi:hypothetical protein